MIKTDARYLQEISGAVIRSLLLLVRKFKSMARLPGARNSISADKVTVFFHFYQ
jgi:hypothetical protein